VKGRLEGIPHLHTYTHTHYIHIYNNVRPVHLLQKSTHTTILLQKVEIIRSNDHMTCTVKTYRIAPD